VADERLMRYREYRTCCGYKNNCKKGLGAIYQADTYFGSELKYNYRDTVDTPKMIKLLQAAKAIISMDKSKGVEMNEFEKLYVSEFIKEGYISVVDDKPTLNVPVFTEAQFGELNNIVNQIKKSLGEDFLKEYLDGYSSLIDKYIPKFLDKNVRNYHKYAMMGGFDLFAHMIMRAKDDKTIELQMPCGEDARYAMTWLVLE